MNHHGPIGSGSVCCSPIALVNHAHARVRETDDPISGSRHCATNLPSWNDFFRCVSVTGRYQISDPSPKISRTNPTMSAAIAPRDA